MQKEPLFIKRGIYLLTRLQTIYLFEIIPRQIVFFFPTASEGWMEVKFHRWQSICPQMGGMGSTPSPSHNTFHYWSHILFRGYPSDWSQVPSGAYPSDWSKVPSGLSTPSHDCGTLWPGLGYPHGQDWGTSQARTGVPPPAGRTSHGQDTLQSVRLLRFHAGGLSCNKIIVLWSKCEHYHTIVTSHIIGKF